MTERDGHASQGQRPGAVDCRGPHCSSRFVWVDCLKRDGQLGRVPLELEPWSGIRPTGSLRGLFVLLEPGRVRAARRGDTGPFYRSHFASCPDAARFRGAGRQRARS
ncbi:MAG: hypothetical protein OEO20_11420 [Gemmatimonadota bacterium]|nr:hypothetical protein [Gemmatimonadota bacterium]MDH3366514.1 hypothetical protein [Gemmatimonadota bacterium]MDH3478903.1 hypothetical protein [Gemmatimonadota bacterium]MDH3571818.1 hypothetical protein [Gemmatimonadota bacterium]